MSTVIFRFILLGPLIGGITFLFTQGLLKDPGNFEALTFTDALLAIPQFIFGLVAAGVLSSIVAYPAGLTPAALSGFAYWAFLKQFTTRNPRYFPRLIIGGLIGLILSGLTGGLLLAPKDENQFATSLLAWCIAGFTAGALCALSLGGKSYAKAVAG